MKTSLLTILFAGISVVMFEEAKASTVIENSLLANNVGYSIYPKTSQYSTGYDYRIGQSFTAPTSDTLLTTFRIEDFRTVNGAVGVFDFQIFAFNRTTSSLLGPALVQRSDNQLKKFQNVNVFNFTNLNLGLIGGSAYAAIFTLHEAVQGGQDINSIVASNAGYSGGEVLVFSGNSNPIFADARYDIGFSATFESAVVPAPGAMYGGFAIIIATLFKRRRWSTI